MRSPLKLKFPRCFRLQKDCVAQITTTRKRRTPKPTYVLKLFVDKAKSLRRVAQLEKTVDGLVSLLAATKQPVQKQGLDSVSDSGLASPPVSVEHSLSSRDVSRALQNEESFPSSASILLRSDGSTRLPELQWHDEIGVDSTEARRLLSVYQTQLCERFPYVVIPQNTTPRWLYQNKPLLFKAVIMAASFNDLAMRKKTRSEIMAHLTEHLILKGEKSLDLLQGLLLFASWYATMLLLLMLT